MHLELTAAQARFAAEVEVFARDCVAPAAAGIDETGTFPLDLVRQAASHGYLGMRAPASAGGRGLDHVAYVLGHRSGGAAPARRWP